MKNALVLSGGSVKGCFQAGAIQAVFEKGFIPGTIYGTSVGSLNGAFLCNEAGKIFKGKQNTPLSNEEWITVAKNLVDFWKTEITKPDDVAIKRKLLKVGYHVFKNNFHGLSDTSPVHEKIDTVTNLNLMKTSPLKLKVGTVDFITSNLIEPYPSPGIQGFIDYLKGSMAIPIAMPPSYLGKQILFDGGAREVAPIGTAINDKNENIIAILCHAENLETDSDFNDGNLMQLVERLQDIVVNQNVKNDSEWIKFINQLLIEAKGKDIPSLSDYKLIEHTIIRPAKALSIDIADFDSNDISTLITQGYETAKTVLNKVENKTLLANSVIK